MHWKDISADFKMVTIVYLIKNLRLTKEDCCDFYFLTIR